MSVKNNESLSSTNLFVFKWVIGCLFVCLFLMIEEHRNMDHLGVSCYDNHKIT